MSPRTPAAETIEAFAVLCAKLDDPFADRASVLAAAGLEEALFRDRRAEWLAKIGSDDSHARELADAFAEAYEAFRTGADPVFDEMEAPEGAGAGEPSAPAAFVPAPAPPQSSPIHELRPLAVPSFLKERPAATAPISAASPVAQPAPQQAFSTETAEVNVAHLLAGLSGKMPFDPSRPSAAAVPSVAPRPRDELAGQTLDLDVGAIARLALAAGPPLTARAAPLPPTVEIPTPEALVAPAGKRLVRFDPQTGQPLAEPRWEDLPAPPGRKDR